MKTLILLLSLLVSLPAQAASDRYFLWAASTTAIVADWGTTLDIKNHPGHREANSYLGPHPSDEKINQYFIGLILLNFSGNFFIERIPEKYSHIKTFLRYAHNLNIIMAHGRAAQNNISLGLKINF